MLHPGDLVTTDGGTLPLFDDPAACDFVGGPLMSLDEVALLVQVVNRPTTAGWRPGTHLGARMALVLTCRGALGWCFLSRLLAAGTWDRLHGSWDGQ